MFTVQFCSKLCKALPALDIRSDPPSEGIWRRETSVFGHFTVSHALKFILVKIKYTGKYIPIPRKSREKNNLNLLLKVSSSFLFCFIFFILFYFLFWDDQWGMTTRRKRGEAQEKTKFLILPGPREMVTQTKRGPEERAPREWAQPSRWENKHPGCFYWGSGCDTKEKVQNDFTGALEYY